MRVQARHKMYRVNLGIKLTRRLEEILLRRLNEDDSFELRSKPAAFKQTGNMTDKNQAQNKLKYMHTDENIRTNQTITTQHQEANALCNLMQNNSN